MPDYYINVGGVVGGDLTGSLFNPTVAGIQGRSIASTAPSSGQAMAWNSTTNQWEPTSVSGVGGGSALSASAYVTIGNDAGLTSERALTAGTGILITDAGANSTVTLGIKDGVVATISGSTFTGAVTAASGFGFTGSLTKLVGGAPFITAVAGNVITVSTGSGGQVILSGSGGSNVGAPLGAQYLTLAADPQLSVERVLTPGTGLKATDAGAGAAYTLNVNDGVVATLSGSTFSGPIVASSTGGITGSITQLVGGAPFITAVAGNVITITTGSGGQIIFSGSGGTASGGSSGGGDPGAQYLVLAATGSLSAERVLTPSTGLKAVDAGANGNYTLTVHDGTFAALTGSNFTGAVSFDGGGVSALTKGTDVFNWFSGSATKVGGPTVTTQNRKVTVFGGDVIYSGSQIASGAVSFDSQLRTASFFGTDVQFYVSGSVGIASGYNRRVFVLGGDSVFSGSITAANNGGITGSITQTTAGTPFITVPAGNMISISTGSNGQIILSGTGDGTGAASGAPTNAQYLTLATDGTLSAERVFTAGTGISVTDAGANGAFTVGVNDRFFAALTGSVFTGIVQHSAAAATLGTDVFFYVSGSSGLNVTGSNVSTPATRKVALFGGDLVFSGSMLETRPISAVREWQWKSGSVTTSTTAFVAYTWKVPSGSGFYDVKATVTDLAAAVGAVTRAAHIKNITGTVTQLGTAGGVDGGNSFSGSFGCAIDVANGLGRLVLSGSSTTAKWSWVLNGLEALA